MHGLHARQVWEPDELNHLGLHRCVCPRHLEWIEGNDLHRMRRWEIRGYAGSLELRRLQCWLLSSSHGAKLM